jgi:hypothetical protein
MITNAINWCGKEKEVSTQYRSRKKTDLERNYLVIFSRLKEEHCEYKNEESYTYGGFFHVKYCCSVS